MCNPQSHRRADGDVRAGGGLRVANMNGGDLSLLQARQAAG